MKAMKLYSDVHRIYNNLAALGFSPDAPLQAADLAPFDQYHYEGTEAVDLALSHLSLTPGETLLDIGSGIGGPARHAAQRAQVRVTALELQADLSAVAADLTARCGLSPLVSHETGDILDGTPRGPFDGILSLLCMLHIPDKPRLFAACRAALKPGRTMYIEDFALARPLTAAETETLATKVQCRDLPSPAAYRAQLLAAGFPQTDLADVTAQWRAFSASRVQAFTAARAANEAIHGPRIVADLLDFYRAVDALWQSGALSGLRITAR